jgi:hypothetical protein
MISAGVHATRRVLEVPTIASFDVRTPRSRSRN